MNRQILTAINYLLEILKYAIIARAVLSFFPISGYNPLVRILYQVTEPILSPIKRMMDNSGFGKNMMIDITPIIALLLLELVGMLAATIL
jgi:YggT family protein